MFQAMVWTPNASRVLRPTTRFDAASTVHSYLPLTVPPIAFLPLYFFEMTTCPVSSLHFVPRPCRVKGPLIDRCCLHHIITSDNNLVYFEVGKGGAHGLGGIDSRSVFLLIGGGCGGIKLCSNGARLRFGNYEAFVISANDVP